MTLLDRGCVYRCKEDKDRKKLEPVVQVPSTIPDQMIDRGRRRPSAALGDILSQWRPSP